MEAAFQMVRQVVVFLLLAALHSKSPSFVTFVFSQKILYHKSFSDTIGNAVPVHTFLFYAVFSYSASTVPSPQQGSASSPYWHKYRLLHPAQMVFHSLLPHHLLILLFYPHLQPFSYGEQ